MKYWSNPREEAKLIRHWWRPPSSHDQYGLGGTTPCISRKKPWRAWYTLQNCRDATLPATQIHRHYQLAIRTSAQWSRPSTQRRWVQRIRRARAMFLKQGSYQQSITHYDQRQNQRTPNTPITDSLRAHSHVLHQEGTTTQQRMTSFFPEDHQTQTHTRDHPEILRYHYRGRWGWVPIEIVIKVPKNG